MDRELYNKQINSDKPSRVTCHTYVTRKASIVSRHLSFIAVAIMIFASGEICYTQNNVNNKNNAGALYSEPSFDASTKQNNENNGGALFQAPPDSGPLRDRPGDGEGIGQDDSVPVDSGFFILLGFCLLYAIVKNIRAPIRRFHYGSGQNR